MALLPRKMRLAARPPALIAVSKTQPEHKLQAALDAGLRLFGENRVQEAQAKWPALKQRYPDIQLHLIGKLQSNKAKDAVALFDAIHTLDRVKLADALQKEMRAQNRKLQVLVQVNIGCEPQKAGVMPDDLDGLLAHCQHIGLEISGLMCIPPVDLPSAPYFALLYKIARARELDALSMGMSADFETAIQQGATMIRLGTALFGKRDAV
jgi:pyridoxal phosphate enzyme (YggS family)